MKRIGVLTSGGDAPGMNAAIRAVVRKSNLNNLEVVGVHGGFAGLLSGDFKDISRRDVGDIIHRGGTILYSARCDEFKTELGQRIAARHLQEAEVDGLIVIGGDGSFRGGQALAKLAPTICIPATIDNDIPFTETTIGFDSAINTVVTAMDKIRDTATSHERIFVIEVMGRDSGNIALWSGLAGGAEEIIIPEQDFNFTDLVKKLHDSSLKGKRYSLIVVAEGVCSGVDLARRITRETSFDTRASILGHIQRGGSPTVADRVLASNLGSRAVELLLEDKNGLALGIENNKIIYKEISAALNDRREINNHLLKLSEQLSL